MFLSTLALVLSEKVNRALAALAGAVLLLILHVVSLEQAMDHVDLNTLGVLPGMLPFAAIAALYLMIRFPAQEMGRREGSSRPRPARRPAKTSRFLLAKPVRFRYTLQSLLKEARMPTWLSW